MARIDKTVMTKRTDGPISRYINRRISTRLTSIIIKHNIPITPNQVSIISFLLGLLSGALFYMNHLILAGILTQISSIIDGVDGELARALKKTSKFGGFFDAVLDRLADISIITGLGLLIIVRGGYWSFLSVDYLLVIIIAALSGDILVSYIHARAEASLGISLHKLCKIPVFASRDVRLFIIFVGGVLQRPLETIILVAMLSYMYVIVRLIELSLMYLRGELK